MTRQQKQAKFSLMVAQLIIFAYNKGHEIALGHAYRCDDCPIGAENSFHKKCLAIDLNLFRNGVYLERTEDHAFLGKYWKELDPENTWGGDFKNPDGNHYSYGE